MQHLSADTLRDRAQRLRREELRRIGCGLQVEWTTFLRRFAAGISKEVPNAPLPCQGPAPSHP